MKKLVTLALAACLLPHAAFADNRNERAGLALVLRETERVLTLAPGQWDFVAANCLPGETVVSGGPALVPIDVTLMSTGFYWDGVGSGWSIYLVNRGTEPLTTTARVGALCTKGTITYGGMTTMFPN